METPLITVICPVFNEEESVPIFYRRLQDSLAPLRGDYRFELLFTNNRSKDTTLPVILALREKDPSVQVLTFSRNFGYQASVSAGLRYAKGDAIIVIDVDCEDPPEMIPRFLEEWRNGFDLVYGDRKKRIEFFAVHWLRLLFYRVNRWMADNEVILDMAEFALFSRRMRDAMLDNRSTFPFLRTEAGFAGFERKGIAYQREARVKGVTHYNFIGMTKFAIGGILSSSTFPLRLTAYLCPIILVADLVLAVLDITDNYSKSFHLLGAISFMYIVMSIAFLAIYLARGFKNGAARAVFIVDWNQTFLNSDLHV